MDDLTNIRMPGFLQEFPDTETLNLRELTGTEFIFTPYARGLDVELQEKLEEFVDGRGMIQARTQRRMILNGRILARSSMTSTWVRVLLY